VSAPPDPARSPHRALLYDDPDDFVEAVGPFLREGLRGGEKVLAAVAPDKRGWLREELGADARAVDFLDAGVLYARQGPMFRMVLDYLQRHASPGAGRARVVAERPAANGGAAVMRGYMRYEAAANVAYEDYDARVICPYDTAALPEAIVEDALRTHPEVLEDDRVRPSALFMDPRAFVRRRVRPRAAPPGAPAHGIERPEDLAGARALVRAEAERASLADDTIADLVLAVSEVGANALVHGEAPRTVWAYVEQDALVCQVRDAGPGLADPLAGYLPPDRSLLSGRGLWLTHQFCDVVEIASDAGNTDVYLHVAAPGAIAAA
jgi:anti-sigma regulatory factor (Ser/Thr protein kinase)